MLRDDVVCATGPKRTELTFEMAAATAEVGAAFGLEDDFSAVEEAGDLLLACDRDKPCVVGEEDAAIRVLIDALLCIGDRGPGLLFARRLPPCAGAAPPWFPLADDRRDASSTPGDPAISFVHTLVDLVHVLEDG